MSTQEPSSPGQRQADRAGVRLVRMGVPFRSRMYLIDTPDGPIAFDAGIKGSAAEILGPATRPSLIDPAHRVARSSSRYRSARQPSRFRSRLGLDVLRPTGS